MKMMSYLIHLNFTFVVGVCIYCRVAGSISPFNQSRGGMERPTSSVWPGPTTHIISLACCLYSVCPRDAVVSQETETLTALPCVASLIVLTAKNFFRVWFRSGGQLQSHCFQASDSFNKQQWINCIRQAKEAAALTGQPTALGRQTGPVLASCSHLGQERERVVWGETDSGQCLEAEVSPGGEADVSLGEESPADGGMSVQTDAEARTGGDATLDTSSQTGEGVLDTAVGVWEMDRGDVDPHSGASSCQEEKEEMEQSSAEEEEVSMETSEVRSSPTGADGTLNQPVGQ